MIKTSPIKDKTSIQSIKSYLKHHKTRDYLLFTISINTPLKACDILELKKEQLNKEINIDGKERYFFMEKDYKFYLSVEVTEMLSKYVEQFSEDDYLFASVRTGKNLTRQQVYRIIHEASIEAGLELSIGVQTLRKTFAYHSYKSGMPIETLQLILGHQSRKETYKFIEIEPEKLNEYQLDL